MSPRVRYLLRYLLGSPAIVGGRDTWIDPLSPALREACAQGLVVVELAGEGSPYTVARITDAGRRAVVES